MEQTASGGSAVEVLTLGEDAELSAPEPRRDALEVLEGGGLVFLRGRGFRLTPGESALISNTREMLTALPEGEIQNGKPTILFDPERGRIERHYSMVRGRLVRAQVKAAALPQLEAMMARFSRWADDLIATLVPRYAPALARDRITYRPHARNNTQSLHIDASYGHPTQGRGMLRLFCNIDPVRRPRVWQLGEPFEPFVERFLARTRPQRAGFASALLSRLGIVRGRKSPYDQLVAQLRQTAMQDQAYQRSAPRRIVEFPSGSAWLAITDLVPHGAISGQHSLDQTWFLPAAGMADPSRASLRILERLTGRALA
jgi:hypothetical protein